MSINITEELQNKINVKYPNQTTAKLFISRLKSFKTVSTNESISVVGFSTLCINSFDVFDTLSNG